MGDLAARSPTAPPESADFLRKRPDNDNRAAIGSSTFRFALAGVLWWREGCAPYWTDRPKLPGAELAALGFWQRDHLAVTQLEGRTAGRGGQRRLARERVPITPGRG